jgi:hypothetical protein
MSHLPETERLFELCYIRGQFIHGILLVFIFSLVSLLSAETADAHGGGTPRLTGEQAGPYRVYVWSEPEPLRQGETHLTIAVTVPAKDATASSQDELVITDADVSVTYIPPGAAGERVFVQAEPQESLGIVYYEADTEIPSSGQWRVSIAVVGNEGSGEVMFEANVSPARRVTTAFIAWALILLTASLTFIAVVARRGQSKLQKSHTARHNTSRSQGKTATSGHT